MVQKSPPAGRPRAFDRAQVLDSAMFLFWRQGYAQTSLDDLERHLGLSRSSLYNAFGSKRALFEEALERYQELLDAQVRVPLNDGHEGLEDIRRFFRGLGSQLDDPAAFVSGCLATNTMIEFGGRDSGVNGYGRAFRVRSTEALRKALLRAVNLGEIDASTVQERVDLLFGMILAVNVTARSGLGQVQLHWLVQAILHVVDGWRLPS